MRRIVQVVYFLVLLFLSHALIASAAGQDGVALRGVVEDASGAPVPGALVKLIQKVTGVELKTTSDESGHFLLPDVVEDEYVLSVKAEGFEAAEVPVEVGSLTTPLRVRLQLAGVKEEVTVSAKLFSAPSAELNTDVIELDQHFLRDLPAKDGDPLAVPMLFVNPAVAGTGGPKIIVDGVETNALDLPVESIKRVYVNRNAYSAEFGRPGKGRIEVTTKHGAHSHYRGNLFTLLRNSALDARNAFANVRPLQQRAVSEAELDGPIGPKLTFFLSGRYDLNNQSSVIHAQTLGGQLVRNFAAPERNTILFGRIDFQINPTHKLTATYKFKNKSLRNQGAGGFNLPERATDVFDHENEVKLFETATLSANFINELRLSLKQQRQSTDSATNHPGIIVLDAFSSGGAQISQLLRERAVDLQDVASLARGKHTLRFGAGTRPKFFQATDASNFGGTFSFSSLAAFSENRPFLFTIDTGIPRVSFTQHEFHAFLQDEIGLRKDTSLLFGLRYEGQSNVNFRKAFAPRLSLAYSPGGGQTVLRAGFGVFYERQPHIMEQQNLLYNGVRIQQIVVSNPGFPVPFDLGAGLAPETPSVVRIAPHIRLPYLMQASFAVERRLGGRNYLTVEYATVRGVRLYRMRNINAPLPGATIRPNPNFINIDEFESSGASRGNSLTLTLHTRSGKRLDFLSQYTLSRTTDDTGGMFSLPADNYNLLPERGRADFDRRHRFNLIATYRLPWDFRAGGIVNISSGPPFNITTGLNKNQDTVANQRPPGVTRNTGQGPGFASVDLRCSRLFRFKKESSRPDVELAIDAFNFLNHVNPKNFVGTLTSPFFGRANASYPARQLQLSLRFHF